MFLLLPSKTNGHGSQVMARYRVVEAVGSGVEGSEAPSSEEAQGSAPRRNPEENCAAAQATVRRLEVALAALEESDVAAREAIQASLVKARATARVIPLSDRITECRFFIERAERRVTKPEEVVQAAVSWKKQMEAEVEEGRARCQARLRRLEEEEVQVVPVPTTSEVQRLQALVAQLQSQLVHRHIGRTFGQSVGSSCREAMSSGRLCPTLRRRDAAGHLQEVSRISHLLTTAAQEWQELIDRSTTMPSIVANAVR